MTPTTRFFASFLCLSNTALTKMKLNMNTSGGGGSPPGRKKKIQCEFQGSFEKLEKQYFSGEASTYMEEQFER